MKRWITSYLWHQPVLAFARVYLLDTPTNSTYLMLLLHCVGLAYLTWRFVETPFRNKELVSSRVVWFAAAICTGLLLGFGYMGYRNSGFPNRLTSLGIKQSSLDSDCQEYATFYAD